MKPYDGVINWPHADKWNNTTVSIDWPHAMKWKQTIFAYLEAQISLEKLALAWMIMIEELEHNGLSYPVRVRGLEQNFRFVITYQAVQSKRSVVGDQWIQQQHLNLIWTLLYVLKIGCSFIFTTGWLGTTTGLWVSPDIIGRFRIFWALKFALTYCTAYLNGHRSLTREHKSAVASRHCSMSTQSTDRQPFTICAAATATSPCAGSRQSPFSSTPVPSTLVMGRLEEVEHLTRGASNPRHSAVQVPDKGYPENHDHRISEVADIRIYWYQRRFSATSKALSTDKCLWYQNILISQPNSNYMYMISWS